jgi:hypothetical protein
MAGLTSEDIRILAYYAREQNRELYFNYLSQKAGNDGYGMLALGVVRNDNAPGATANEFADQQARRDGVVMSDREWQQFGVDLMRSDLSFRQAQLKAGHPELALNLPAKDVQASHDVTFEKYNINPDAWTPRQLLESARRHGGEPETEKVWSMMLDNSLRGVWRMGATTDAVTHRYNDDKLDATAYMAQMTAARTLATQSLPNTDPNTIGAVNFKYRFSPQTGEWMESYQTGRGLGLPRTVEDPALIRELNEARDVRLEREQMRQQFHPEDPYRDQSITSSPWLISDASPTSQGVETPQPMQAALSDIPQIPARYAELHQQCVAGVRNLDRQLGREWDEKSARMAASVTHMAASNGLHRVDEIVLSEKGGRASPGEFVFAVQGDRSNPASRRAHMGTDEAIGTPVEQSARQLADLNVAQAQQLNESRQQEQDVQRRGGMNMQA